MELRASLLIFLQDTLQTRGMEPLNNLKLVLSELQLTSDCSWTDYLGCSSVGSCYPEKNSLATTQSPARIFNFSCRTNNFFLNQTLQIPPFFFPPAAHFCTEIESVLYLFTFIPTILKQQLLFLFLKCIFCETSSQLIVWQEYKAKCTVDTSIPKKQKTIALIPQHIQCSCYAFSLIYSHYCQILPTCSQKGLI